VLGALGLREGGGFEESRECLREGFSIFFPEQARRSRREGGEFMASGLFYWPVGLF
jgi:hypothetical protein